MPEFTLARSALACLAFPLLLTSCYGPVPKAKRTFPVAATVSNERLFECAQQSISKFEAAGEDWPQITRNDPRAGVLESGNFGEDNVYGFRMRIERPSGRPQADILMKGAGAYYFDLGVDRAADSLVASLGECTNDQTAP